MNTKQSSSYESGRFRQTGHMLRALLPAAALAMACWAPSVAAQVQRSFVNPGFETPVLTSSPAGAGCYLLLDETLVPGWTTTHPSQTGGGSCIAPAAGSGRLIELWSSNFQGVPARQGNNFSELNASASSRLFQNVCLINGESIDWRFSHRGRGSATVGDVMDFNVGASVPVVRVSTTSSGVFGAPILSQGTAQAPAAAGNGWVDYTGTFSYSGATGTNSLGFESISTGSGSNTVGNFLDNIQIDLRPFVEFVQPSSSTPESASNNRPTLRINGTVFTAFDVVVTITGGTATLGTDYATPGNSATLTVTIPVGTYDGVSAASLFALPITVTQDLLVESNETIQLQVQPAPASPAPYLLNSSASCGGVAQTTWTYTIVDDDASINLTKNAAAPVAVAGQPTQFDVAYTLVVNNPTLLPANYSLTDTPGLDANVNVVSASYTLNGGAASALSGGGPWTLQPQWRSLAAGATDTYQLTVRINVNRGGTTSNDACAAPSVAGSGLHNSASAVLQGVPGNTTFNASACRNTPTPVWVSLRKQLSGRAVATDQVQVRLLSGGNPNASAVTTGSATPASASTGLVVLAAGNTMQFEEAVKQNGTGADQAPTNYATSLVCTNATAGSATVLPSGAGTALATSRQWAEFTPASGDDLDCLITNTPNVAQLQISKTNTPAAGPADQASDTVTQGLPTIYQIVVRNNGPLSANGAVVSDPAATGLTCTTASCAAAGGAACPAVTGAALVTALQNGVTIPTLPVNGTATFTLTCTVN
ncbi:MAG TPA: hypothetical protein VF471_10870 [Pseudoxanthomonas sp.]